MKFDKSKVYTALNADEVKIGSKVIVGDYLGALKSKVENFEIEDVSIIKGICDENCEYRFLNSDDIGFALAYLIEEPMLLYKCYLNIIDGKFNYTSIPITNHVYARFLTEEEAEKWCNERQKFAEIAKAWEEGKQIQFNSQDNIWKNIEKPSFNSTHYKYRIKPELHWYDLKVGDVIKSGTREELVTVKEYDVDKPLHIYASHWINDKTLSEYTLVRRAKDV